ncbi:hypothetical protein Tco_0407675 [Tanacetum coccineum]
MDTVKFKASPPMTGPAENRNKNKFCEFHGDKGHSTDECIHLRRQIEEAVKSGQLSHLVKEIKQGGKRREQAKAAKKGEAPNKEKATVIFMIQPWQRITRQKTTQSFSADQEISFSILGDNIGQETPIVIEAEVEGHRIHRVYMDGGSASEVLYEHCFNRLHPKIKNQMVPARTLLLEFSGEISWPLGENITDGNFRRYRTINKRLDELHGCQISVTVQRYHRSPGSQENPSDSFHHSRNAKILSGRRNSDNLQQYHNTSGM